VRLERLADAAQQLQVIDPGFTVRRFATTVGVVPVVSRVAEAWRAADLPD
jgi:hypothetical protein